MTGIVGIPCSESGTRSALFMQALSGLRTPPGFGAVFSPGSSIAKNRNNIIRLALKDNVDYVLFLDDDQVFAPDLLDRLLEASDVGKYPIISGLYCTRLHPNVPMLFDHIDEDGAVYYRKLKDDDRGLIQVAGTGAGCLLVHTDVFRKIGHYLFKFGEQVNWFQVGQINTEDSGEDLSFFKLCKELSIPVHVDLDTPVGHIAQVAIWPGNIDGRGWEILSVNNGFPTVLPYPEFIKEMPREVPSLVTLN